MNTDPTAPDSTLDGIAVIGMAGRFPGADDVATFWENLLAARETIDSLRREDIAAGEPVDDPEYLRRRGLVKDADCFDAPFFGMSRIEAEVTDPQQRLFLESAWTAVEHAGYDPFRLPGVTGVWAGSGNNHYFHRQLQGNRPLLETAGAEAVMIGNEKDYIATRVAYKLNLRGPAINVVTACSTSLVAVCQAVQSLLTYGCDMALAGGVSVRWPQNRGYLHEEGSIFSPDGHCRAFDEKSAGTVFSSGCGCVVLKRLGDAVRDGDTVYAVIKGVALNNDGSGKVSFTAPGVDGQADNVTMALALADVPADTVDYVEAHGTGTALGDVIEVAALTQAFRASGDGRIGECGLGSLKTATGHMDAAAGVGGLIKTVLSLHHGVVPATLHFTKPNAKLQLESSPFRVVAEPLTLEHLGRPSRALVAALGVGGTNAHVVAESFIMPAKASASGDRSRVFLLSARSELALAAAADRLAGHLSTQPATDLADVEFTLAAGRTPFAFRRVLVADSAEKLIAQCREMGPPATAATTRPVAFLFPGQGSQAAGMGAGLREAYPTIRRELDRIAALMGRDPLAGSDDELRETANAQPALFALSYAIAVQLTEWGVTPSQLLGHSIGEYAAATLAGVFGLEDAVKLVMARGRLMQAQPAGVMLAVRLPEAEIELPDSLDLAAVNGPALCVVAGSEEAVAGFEASLKSRGVGCKRLVTSHAFHSRLMDGALEEFRRIVEGVSLRAPSLTVISNVTGAPLTAEQATDPGYWVNHLRSTVRFFDGVKAVANDHVLVEVGSGNVLGQLARQAGARHVVNTLPPAKAAGVGNPASLLEALGAAWVHGADVAWDRYLSGEERRRVALPTYPFERRKYCPEAVTLPEAVTALPTPPSSNDTFAPSAGESKGAVETVSIPASTVPRRERLLADLHAQFLKISGVETSAHPATTPLLDLGFDSLFLTQAGMVLKKHFGVKITFRQLMEELTSLDALAGYLDANLPAEAAVSVAPSTTVEPATDGRPGDSQWRVAVGELKGADGKKIAFGPFRSIEKGDGGKLTARQSGHLRQLIEDYCAKYRRTKASTADNRPHFADPRAVGGFNPLWKEMVFPAVTERSEGPYLWDVDGHRWIDVVHGFGSGFFGHRPAFIVEALKRQLDLGYEIGPTHPLAGEVARRVCALAGQDRAGFCNTGSEALMAAIRVSRTITGRELIVMFAGSYHGIFDEVLARPLVQNGELRSIPIAPGIPETAQHRILVLEYGHPESLEIVRRHGADIAAVLVEPVPSRRPDIAPVEFVQQLRKITRESGTALIFDEVVLGFRTHPRGAQHLFGVDADLVAYGKVIGGGLPLGILAGKRAFMDALDGGQWRYGDKSAPEVGVTFFAGTFIRHPLTLAACKAVLDELDRRGPALQEELDRRTAEFVAKLDAQFEAAGVPIKVTRYSSLWMLNADPGLKYYSLLFYHLRLRGIHIWEGRGNFISVAHEPEDIEGILAAFRESVAALQQGGFFPGGPEIAEGARRVPLTPEQQELFLASRMSEAASVSCHESISLHFDRMPEVARLDAALQALVARHDALRLRFDPDGAMQVIEDAARLELPVVEGDLERERAAEFDRPFDLAVAPLLRAKLVKSADGSADLLLTGHHIVCDGWSYGVLAKDLAALYAGRELPPAPSFADYADSLIVDREACDFWERQFSAIPPALDLPGDRSRTADDAREAGTVRLQLGERVAERVKQFCRAEKTTPNALLLTVWEILLARLSGLSDLVIGTPMAGQAASGQDGMVGHCVHFLPLRAEVDFDAPARVLLARTRDRLIDATEHQQFTLGQLLQSLKVRRTPGRPSFVTNTFTLESEPAPLDFGDGLLAALEPNPKRKLGFDLSAFAIQGAGGITLQIVHSAALFDGATVERWAGHFAALLEAVLDRPEQNVGLLPLMDAAQRAVVASEFNDSGCASPPEQGIGRIFEEMARQFPESPAVVTADRTVSYARLNAQANGLAERLIALGVKQDTLVGVFMERSPEMIAALLAVLKAGGAYVPIDPHYPEERIAMMVGDIEAPVIVTQGALRSRLAVPAGTTVIEWERTEAEAAERAGAANPSVKVLPDQLAYVIYTSGSTGKPKGAAVTHRGVVRLVRNQNFATMDAGETWLQLAPLSFDASTLEIWAPLCNGGRLALMPAEKASLGQIGEAIRDFGVTSVWLTAGLFQLMVDEHPESLGGLRQLLTGGDVVSPPHARRILERFPELSLINGYGPTENTTFTCCHRISPADTEAAALPIGRPVAHTTVHIVDARDQLCPVGVPGELVTGGAGLARGYWRRAALTVEKFVELPGLGRVYRTGDLARWRADGTIEFLGRIDGQLKIRGFRIEPGEIEALLSKHPAIQRAVVVARGGSAGEKRLVAYYVPNAAVTVKTESLRSFLSQNLPDYMVPSAFVAMPAGLPLTSNGKVDVRALPAADIDETAARPAASFTKPRNRTEQKLRDLWLEALGRNSFGVTDNFFELGGDSLQGLRLFTRIQKAFGLSLPLGTLFTAPTIEQLARALDSNMQTTCPQHVIPIQREGTRAPLFCVHGGDGGVMFYRQMIAGLGLERPVYGIEAPMLMRSDLLQPEPSVEAVARLYIESLLEVQPDGPYLLSGFSFGGLVAYEMAQQLKAMGKEVALLALYDTDNPTIPPRYFSLPGRVMERWKMESGLSLGERVGRLTHRVKSGLARRRELQNELAVVNAAAAKAERAPEEFRAVEIREAHMKLVRDYRPKPYDGAMVLFRCTGKSDKFEHTKELGWEGLIRDGVEVCEVTGTHLELFDEPHVHVLAHRLRQVLDQLAV